MDALSAAGVTWPRTRPSAARRWWPSSEGSAERTGPADLDARVPHFGALPRERLRAMEAGGLHPVDCGSPRPAADVRIASSMPNALRLSDLPTGRPRGAPSSGAAPPIVLCWVFLDRRVRVLPIGHESSAARLVVRLGADVALGSAPSSPGRSDGSPWPRSRSCGPSRPCGIVIALLPRRCSRASTWPCRTNRVLTFTQHLDQTTALYFTVSIFSTVGFGDITHQDRRGPRRRRHPDAVGPRHHRRRCPPHLRAARSRITPAAQSWRRASLLARRDRPAGPRRSRARRSRNLPG